MGSIGRKDYGRHGENRMLKKLLIFAGEEATDRV